jgi:hypothetical protein
MYIECKYKAPALFPKKKIGMFKNEGGLVLNFIIKVKVQISRLTILKYLLVSRN